MAKKVTPKIEEEAKPQYKKPWKDAVLCKFLATSRRIAPSPSQKSLEHVGTQGYSLRKPGEIFFVSKEDASYRCYHKLTAAEIKALLPAEPTDK